VTVEAAKVAYADVGSIGDFTVGKMVKVDIPGKDVYVMRTPDDTWFAIKNTCPHHGAPLCLGHVEGTFLPTEPGADLEFGLDYRVIRCPHHAYEYDLETGRALFIPDVTDRIVRYDVRTENDRVLVSLKGR
jgi:3-phenylpropionate/trans-cinnamate dioxygenase ferredoxin subunit